MLPSMRSKLEKCYRDVYGSVIEKDAPADAAK